MRRVTAAAAISIALAGVIVVAVVSLLRPGPADDGGLPADCGTTPSAYHPGAIVDWPGSDTVSKTAEGASAGHFARVRFDSGRMVLAYNATPARPAPGTRVVVSEIRCVHRTIHMLTELGAPAAPATDPKGATRAH